MIKKIISIVFVTFSLSSASIAQEIEVSGGFIQDEIRIGEPVQYWLKAKYPTKMEVLFPDMEYPFTPFEVSDKDYFPSKYDSLFVIDSAVYTLTSFEIDTYQKLSLPVFLISANDSIKIDANVDSLRFVELVPNASDTTSLKTDLNYSEVPLQINYPYFLIALGGLILISIILALVFGKTVIRYFKIKSVKKNYLTFSSAYDLRVDKFTKNPTKIHLEDIIAYWKKYMEKLNKKPYTKLTTKEIIRIMDDNPVIKENLSTIDRNIYGPLKPGDLQERLLSIKNLALEYQQKKIAAIKNG